MLRRGEVAEGPPTGLPVGTLASAHYAARTIHLEPNDHLLLSTDGVTEARDRHGVEYGSERLERLVLGHPWSDPGALLTVVRSDLTSHLGGVAAQDDLTLLVVSRWPTGGGGAQRAC